MRKHDDFTGWPKTVPWLEAEDCIEINAFNLWINRHFKNACREFKDRLWSSLLDSALEDGSDGYSIWWSEATPSQRACAANCVLALWGYTQWV